MADRLTEFDWTEIILDLRRSGMRQHEIVREIGRAAGEASIRQYLAGATPVHWRGEILLNLWSEKTGKVRRDAPTRPAKIYPATPRRRRQGPSVLMPNEHLPAVARAYGVTVADLVRMLSDRKKERAPTSARHQMQLPGFES